MRRALISLVIIAGAQAQAPPAISTIFYSKYNSFVEQMNTVAGKLQENVADRKAMLRAAKLWERLYRDEGWLK